MQVSGSAPDTELSCVLWGHVCAPACASEGSYELGCQAQLGALWAQVGGRPGERPGRVDWGEAPGPGGGESPSLGSWLDAGAVQALGRVPGRGQSSWGLQRVVWGVWANP